MNEQSIVQRYSTAIERLRQALAANQDWSALPSLLDELDCLRQQHGSAIEALQSSRDLALERSGAVENAG